MHKRHNLVIPTVNARSDFILKRTLRYAEMCGGESFSSLRICCDILCRPNGGSAKNSLLAGLNALPYGMDNNQLSHIGAGIHPALECSFFNSPC